MLPRKIWTCHDMLVLVSMLVSLNFNMSQYSTFPTSMGMSSLFVPGMIAVNKCA